MKKLIDYNIKVEIFKDDPNEVLLNSVEYKEQFKICQQKYDIELKRLEEYKQFLSTKCIYHPQQHLLSIYIFVEVDLRFQIIYYSFENGLYEECYRSATYGGVETVKTLQSLFENKEEQVCSQN